MAEHQEQQVPIWFFIGVILAIYGVLVLGAGIYGLAKPQAEPRPLSEYHPEIWWGALLLVTGLFYSVRFRPGRPRS